MAFVKSTLLLLLAVAHLASALPTWWPWKRAASICNGRAELCNRSYGNTTFLTSHNAFAWSPIPFALARNQAVDLATQLRLGVRALQGQAQLDDGKFKFCHTTCDLFDGGTVADFLKKVKTFLDANPNEVITLIFTNPKRLSVPEVWKPAFDQAGISQMAYVPPTRLVKRNEWPTLGQLIDSGKRVVVFLDEGADGSAGGIVDFILPQFEMMWEDPFSSTDPNFPCRIDRSRGPLSNDDHMHMINHNLNRNIVPWDLGTVLISDWANAPKTNAMSSITAHANGCAKFSQGRAPNFVLMDYVDVGEGKKTVDRLNGF